MTKMTALLLMGGSGRRFGAALPKQFHRLFGKKIYQYTLETFLAIDAFEEIIIVCHSDWIDEVKLDIRSYPHHSRIKVVPGGETRQASSHLGLSACNPQTQFVVIHDAVRAFISRSIIEQHIAAVPVHGAVNTCIPSSDTIIHSSNGFEIDDVPPRSEYFRAQTPQSFHYSLICKAHALAQHHEREGATDDCGLVLNMGKKVHILPGDERNFKITTPLDFILAQQLLRANTQATTETPLVSLQGKRIAITGGTGGIGSAIAELLRQEGAIPIVLSRKTPKYAVDITSAQSVEKVFKQIHTDHGELDGLINSVGLFKVKEVSQLSETEIQELIAVNLMGLIYSCKAACLKPDGHIINIASSSYSRGRKDFAVYSSAKAGVVNFTQGFAEEHPDKKINVVVPERTCTLMRQRFFPHENPLSLLAPETVAQAVVNLLKQDSVTGTTVEVRIQEQDARSLLK